jgi:hypothetical protein
MVDNITSTTRTTPLSKPKTIMVDNIDKGVVYVIVILSTITVKGLTEEWFMLLLYWLELLFKVRQRSGSCYCCYIVQNNNQNMNHSSIKP